MSEQQTQCPADTLRTPGGRKRGKTPKSAPSRGMFGELAEQLFGSPAAAPWHQRLIAPLRNLSACARHGGLLAMWTCGSVTFMLVCAALVHHLMAAW